jgi:protein-disulfide isomerase
MGGAFLAAIGHVGGGNGQTLAVYGGQDSTVKVFLSPSCGHCQERVFD